MIAYVCAPVSEQAGVRIVMDQARVVLGLLDAIIDGLDDLVVSRQFFRKINDDAICCLERLWPPKVSTNIVHMLAVAVSLVADLRYELAAWLSQKPQTDELWNDMERALDGLYDMFDPEGVEDYPHVDDVPRLYAAVREHVFGPEKADPQVRLYLLGGRFWVAALTKAEACDHLRRELGLVGMKAQSIALGEKLEDGRRAGDMLALARSVPCIIGRTE